MAIADASKVAESSVFSRHNRGTSEMDTRHRVIADRASQMPKAARSAYLRAANGKASPRMAIKPFCMECVGGNRIEVASCTAVACPLWMYRPFQQKNSAKSAPLPQIDLDSIDSKWLSVTDDSARAVPGERMQ